MDNCSQKDWWKSVNIFQDLRRFEYGHSKFKLWHLNNVRNAVLTRYLSSFQFQEPLAHFNRRITGKSRLSFLYYLIFGINFMFYIAFDTPA